MIHQSSYFFDLLPLTLAVVLIYFGFSVLNSPSEMHFVSFLTLPSFPTISYVISVFLFPLESVYVFSVFVTFSPFLMTVDVLIDVAPPDNPLDPNPPLKKSSSCILKLSNPIPPNPPKPPKPKSEKGSHLFDFSDFYLCIFECFEWKSG